MAQPPSKLAPQVALRLTGDLPERLERATEPFALPNIPMTHTDRVRLAIENGIALLQAAAELARREGIAPGEAVEKILGAGKPPRASRARKGRG